MAEQAQEEKFQVDPAAVVESYQRRLADANHANVILETLIMQLRGEVNDLRESLDAAAAQLKANEEDPPMDLPDAPKKMLNGKQKVEA